MQNKNTINLQFIKHLNERQRRIYAGTLAKQYGRGGQTVVHRELGTDFKTIRRGILDLEATPINGVRLPGGGRKKLVDKHPEIRHEVDAIIHKSGDPMKHLTWTHLSIDKVTAILRDCGYQIGKNAVNRLLWKEGFSLKKNQKELHKTSHGTVNKYV